MNDCLPQKVCNGCADKLVEFHLFRKILIESRRKLLDNWPLNARTKDDYERLSTANESDENLVSKSNFFRGKEKRRN